jgi:uncharacterized membrane protein
VILNNTAGDTYGLIDRYLDTQGHEEVTDRTQSLLDRLPIVAEVTAERPGYLRGVDDSRLIELAREHDLLLTMHPRIGDHLFTGSPMLTVRQRTTPRPAEDHDEESGEEGISGRLQVALERVTAPDIDNENAQAADDADPHAALANALRATFTVGIERTLNEDVLFGFQQLADIGLRALSPGVNDPTTAMLSIDQLGEGLIRLQDADDRPTVALDAAGTPRVVYPKIPFEMFLTISFRHIRHYGAGDPFVARHLIEVLEAVHGHATNAQARAAIAEEARTTVDATVPSDPLPADLLRVRAAAAWAYAG